MTKNPMLNALCAFVYICAVVLGINYGSNFAGDSASLLAPIAMLSLFVLSVSVMAYIFFLTPLRLYLDGNKEDGVRLFIKTIGFFALITFVALSVVLIISIGG